MLIDWADKVKSDVISKALQDITFENHGGTGDSKMASNRRGSTRGKPGSRLQLKETDDRSMNSQGRKYRRPTSKTGKNSENGGMTPSY